MTVPLRGLLCQSDANSWIGFCNQDRLDMLHQGNFLKSSLVKSVSFPLGSERLKVVDLLWVGINLVPVTHRDTTGDGCSCYTWCTDPKSGSDYRVVVLLTPAAYISILRANHGQWMMFYIKAVMLTS
jgi:hypothetical protein